MPPNSDGTSTFAQSGNSSNDPFAVTTGSDGSITAWKIFLIQPIANGGFLLLDTENVPGVGVGDFSGEEFDCLDNDLVLPCATGVTFGSNSEAPGTWTGGGTILTPEPGTLSLLSLGMIGLWVFRTKLRLHRQGFDAWF